MKIATWNIERLAHKKELNQILSTIEQINADVLVLTEYDERVKPNYKEWLYTPTPPDTFYSTRLGYVTYAQTEHRIAIYTNYRIVRQYPTFDKHTSLCVEIKTEEGNLIVYGTIMGVFGNNHFSFRNDLEEQCKDFARLAAYGKNMCICGDFNMSFVDNYYHTKEGRGKVLASMEENQLQLVTEKQKECVDHIAISKKFLFGKQLLVEEWNKDKALSDHCAIAVTFSS